jgi:basic membrane lipoprotein Med (substrate-binding protein (PBP1-ABC) superfamily)
VEVHSTYLSNLAIADCSSIITSTLLSGLDGLAFTLWVAGGQQYNNCVTAIEKDPRFAYLKILNLGGSGSSSRVAIGFPAFEEARFLHGILCARASKSHVVGYVASVKTNTFVSKAINAFAVGAKYENPDTRVVVGMTGSFLEVVAETKATQLLIDEAGADCIAQQQNDLTVHAIASRNGKFSIGYTTDARYYAGEQVLVSAQFDWAPIVLPYCRSLLLGQWDTSIKPRSGWASGAISLSSYSTKVQSDWREPVDRLIPAFVNGSFSIFCTPLFNDSAYLTPENTYTKDGNITCLTEEAIDRMVGVVSLAEILVEYNSTNSPYVLLWVKNTNPGAIILYILTAILAIASAGTMVDVFVNRSAPVYRAASPLFCFLTLAGILIGCIAPLLWPGPRTKFNCMATWWAIGIGYGIAISCILAKNWRIWRIFTSERLKVVAIMNTQLLARWVGVIVLGEVIILVLWTIFDILSPITVANARTAGFGEVQLLCASETGKTYGLATFLAYNVLLLILAAFMSYWTRNVKEEYKESTGLAIAVYLSLVVLLVFIALVIATPNDYLVRFYMCAYGAWAVLAVTYVSLFLPKFWRTHFVGSSKSPSSTMQLSTFNSQPAFDSAPNVTNNSYNTQRRGIAVEAGEDAFNQGDEREMM